MRGESEKKKSMFVDLVRRSAATGCVPFGVIYSLRKDRVTRAARTWTEVSQNMADNRKISNR